VIYNSCPKFVSKWICRFKHYLTIEDFEPYVLVKIKSLMITIVYLSLTSYLITITLLIYIL